MFIYIRGEYLTEFEIVRDALEATRAHDLLGGVTIVLHRGAGAYICGEETALLESLEGKRGQPRSKPPFPAISGLYASPTEVNNVELFAVSLLDAGTSIALLTSEVAPFYGLTISTDGRSVVWSACHSVNTIVRVEASGSA